MVIKSVELETVCGITSRLPKNQHPEVAFVGRSNVGKSSLINTLSGRKALARTSAQPGKTQTINFYNLNGQIYLVDLPGYGFARVPPKIKEEWGRMVDRYLRTSRQLKRLFVLVDIRHSPTADDKAMVEWVLAQKVPLTVIATKEDKLSKQEAVARALRLPQELKLPKEVRVVPFSSKTKVGRDYIWEVLDGILQPEEE